MQDRLQDTFFDINAFYRRTTLTTTANSLTNLTTKPNSFLTATKKTMADTSTSFIAIYNAAVTLNNISISLMERRSFSAATTVMHDALAVLQSAIATADCRLSNRPISSAEIEHKVYRARFYLSSESDEEEPPLLIPCMSDEDVLNQDDFCILNQYGQNMNLSEFSLSPSTRKKYIFYIQERTENISENNEIETQITLALFLHNYGQVDRCVASIYHDDRKARADGLLEGANKCFHLSRSLLQDLSCPVSPVLSVAIHQTRLDIECDLGIASSRPDIEAFSSAKNSKKYQSHTHPTVAIHLESLTM
jgi:hypothetical protein